jgi:hypothetical protein
MCAENVKPGAAATATELPENDQHKVNSTNIANSTGAQDFTDYLLARSRVAVFCLRLAANEITANAVALKAGWLTPDEYCTELHDLTLLPLIEGST